MSDETNLSEKYRPKKFRDIVGQPKADTWFRKQVCSKEARSVLLSGPYGTGKSTLALIYAKALFCEAPEVGEPCGACNGCKEFGDVGRGFPDFNRFECGERSRVEEVIALIGIARTPPSSPNGAYTCLTKSTICRAVLVTPFCASSRSHPPGPPSFW